jgi:putative transposase
MPCGPRLTKVALATGTKTDNAGVDIVVCLCFVPSMNAKAKPGWHDRGYIPHFDANTLLQHVVFRTNGSLPKFVLDQIQSVNSQTGRAMMDSALDHSPDGSTFSEPEFANIMQDSLLYFDGKRYDLQAWCVMPNHVHVVVIVYSDALLSKVVQSWKQATARQVNRILGRTGHVFALDYFDRFVRNLPQAERLIHYVEANPVKAGLCATAHDWRWSSAHAKSCGWKPNHERLPVFDA